MVGQYLEALSLDLVKVQESQSTSLDILKEAVQITKTVNFSDAPITKELIDQLSQRLEALTYESIPQNAISFSEPDSQQTWLNFHTRKILSSIQEDILKETRSSWGGILDEGNKVDWYTLQLYRGYSLGLSKLYRWVHHHFHDALGTRAYSIEQLTQVLDEMKNYGNEIEQSWTTSLYWSDSYLIDFANKFKILEEHLSESTK